jgi:RNA recognition motif-containing protein
MREFFSQFGKVVDSTVMLDRETGRSKGFGFVSFEDTDVTPFLGFGNLEIDGKLVGFIVILESSLHFSPIIRLMSSSLSLAPNVITSRAVAAASAAAAEQVVVGATPPRVSTRIRPFPTCKV